MVVSKNNAMLNTFAVDNIQNRPTIVKNHDGCKNVFDKLHHDVVVMTLAEDRSTRKVTTFVDVGDGELKFVANRSFKFDNIDNILDVFIIHDSFYVCYVNYLGWLKLSITPMLKKANQLSRKTRTVKILKVRELTFGRKVHLHAMPNLAVVKTPDKVHILDFASHDSVRKKSSIKNSIVTAFKGLVQWMLLQLTICFLIQNIFFTNKCYNEYKINSTSKT